jgi:hypothetical protein
VNPTIKKVGKINLREGEREITTALAKKKKFLLLASLLEL